MAWRIDNSHSQVQFTVRHMMISNVRGRFTAFTGTVDFNEAEPKKSTVEVNIEAGSIDTRDANRDNHLRSPDFFDAERFPYLTFRSTKIEKVDEQTGRITGDLTIRGITHPVTLEVEYAGQSKMWGSTSAGFSASTKISRREWGLTWNQNLESGGILVGDQIKIDIELEIVKVAEAEAEAVAVAA